MVHTSSSGLVVSGEMPAISAAFPVYRANFLSSVMFIKSPQYNSIPAKMSYNEPLCKKAIIPKLEQSKE